MKLEIGTKKDFQQVYADMLTQFPPSEMKTKAAFLKLLDNKNYDLGVVRNDENQMVSYFLCYRIDSLKMVLLDHFAVVRQYHGKGIGSVVLKLIREHYCTFKGLILEVENPNPEDLNTIRRIKFYQRLGAYKLNMKYLIPAENNSAMLMTLMFLNCANDGVKVEKKEVINALKYIFNDVHSASFSHSNELFEILQCAWSNGL